MSTIMSAPQRLGDVNAEYSAPVYLFGRNPRILYEVGILVGQDPDSPHLGTDSDHWRVLLERWKAGRLVGVEGAVMSHHEGFRAYTPAVLGTGVSGGPDEILVVRFVPVGSPAVLTDVYGYVETGGK